MTKLKLYKLLEELTSSPKESEWIEFKKNNSDPKIIGKNISALSNSARLNHKKYGYLVYGVENTTHRIVGTKFKFDKKKYGNEELENWLLRSLDPNIDFKVFSFQYNDKDIVIFRIEATTNIPIKFQGEAYLRVGSYTKKLDEYPAKERKIWIERIEDDWSSLICDSATLSDLDPEAINKARMEYKKKHPHLEEEVDTWSNSVFLNKAKVTINGNITNAAILLLGKPESEHFISPSVSKLTWILKDINNIEIAYEHFSCPLILNVDNVLSKIRNLKYKYLPDSTLFPIEFNQYDNWVIREALHNCIAHQDYSLRNRITLIEKPDELIFLNAGEFIPGSIDNVIYADRPPDFYRNYFLANAMLNLNMIDTIGSGIKRMFVNQKNRFFPLPDYDISQENIIKVRILGKVIDEKYSKLIMNRPELALNIIILLDKVQKRIPISREDFRRLKAKGLVEGRYPNIYVSFKIASVTGQKAKYIHNKGFHNKYYQDLILEYIKKNKSASRKDIDELLFNKLPDILTSIQKKRKINNILYLLSNQKGTIKNIGSRKYSKWILASNKSL